MTLKSEEHQKALHALKSIVSECEHLHQEILAHHLKHLDFQSYANKIEKQLLLIEQHLQDTNISDANKKRHTLENLQQATALINTIINHDHFYDMHRREALDLELAKDEYIITLRERAEALIEEVKTLSAENAAAEQASVRPGHSYRNPFDREKE